MKDTKDIIEIKDKLVLSPDEAGKYIGSSGAYIRELIAVGALPVIRIGTGDGHLKVRRSDVEEFIAALPAEVAT